MSDPYPMSQGGYPGGSAVDHTTRAYLTAPTGHTKVMRSITTKLPNYKRVLPEWAIIPGSKLFWKELTEIGNVPHYPYKGKHVAQLDVSPVAILASDKFRNLPGIPHSMRCCAMIKSKERRCNNIYRFHGTMHVLCVGICPNHSGYDWGESDDKIVCSRKEIINEDWEPYLKWYSNAPIRVQMEMSECGRSPKETYQ